MAIDPRISLGVQPIQLDNPLAQYGQVQNILAAQQQMRGAETQQKVAGMQLQQLQRNADYVDKMQKAIADNGGPLDIEEAAKMMATHPDPNVAQHGYTLMQAVQDKKLFEDYVNRQNPSATPTAPAMPSMMRQQPETVNKLGSGTYGIDTSAANQLAPAPVPAAPSVASVVTPIAPVVPPVGANLAPAPASGSAQIAQLKKDILELSLLKDPRAKAIMSSKEAELKTLQTPHVIPNVGLADASGNVYVKAPATPTNLARMQAELDALPEGDLRRAQYVSAIQKETQNAPSQLAQLIKERDALPPNDPNRKIYDTQINKTQAELNIQRAHLKLAQDKYKQDYDQGSFKPDTIDMMANVYLQTGAMPPLGMGKKAADARTQILNRAQEISMGGGTTTAAQAATNVVQGKQDVASQTAALKDFSAGPSSKRVTANNTALNHLETMDKLAGDLANTDIRIVNAAGNAFARATGSAAPTSFDAAKQLVAAEVIKAVVQNGGGVTERKEAADNIKSANGPEQLRQVIATYRELLGGQLTSLAQQYETGTGRKDFEKKLSPATRELLKKSTPTAAPTAAPAATKSGATVSNW
jgi:hypothetical protein